MSSQKTSTDSVREPLFVAESGVSRQVPESVDPYAAWIDLMEVVEALCPRWPERMHAVGHTFRL